jgi:hypothetical protein
MSDEESVESAEGDDVLFRDDVILEGSVEDGLVLAAESDPEGDWLTIGWSERRTVGHWVGMEGDRSIDLSLESAEKLLPALVSFVHNGKNATTSYWTGAIAPNPKIAERGRVSSEFSPSDPRGEGGTIILRTEHHALYVNPEDLDDAIAVLIAAKVKLTVPKSEPLNER